MRELLFVSHRVPYPPDKGERIRTFHLLRHMAREWRIHLGCLAIDHAEAAEAAHLRTFCAEVAVFPIAPRLQKAKALARLRPGRPLMLDYYRHVGLAAWVAARLPRTDLHMIASAAMAPYVLDHPRMAPRVLDMIDVDSEKWAGYARASGSPMRMIWAREARTLLAYERAAAAAVEATLFVSAAEAAHFAALAPESRERIGWVENGVDLTRFAPTLRFDQPTDATAPLLVFTGHMDYRPNVDAATWFATRVLALLRRREPAPRFAIVGANPTPAVRRLADLPGVIVTGRVPDTRPWLAQADVAVAPLHIARGIQNKVLEAMAMGRPVVASPGAFEGVRAVAGRDLLVADGAEAMAAAVFAVLDGAHPGLGAAGRAAMEAGYAWPATLARLDAVLARVCPPA